MIFFTKTCARDWKRCCYQMLAIRRFFPLTKHVVMIEEVEFSKRDRGFERQHGMFPAQLSIVDEFMPEAMAITDPDLRQQYVKLRAPIVFGEDMIQIDSDMCPKPVQTEWADELCSTWDYYEDPRQYRDALQQWAETYQSLLKWRVSNDRLLFMNSQYGWRITREAGRAFFCALGGNGDREAVRMLREPQRVVDKILECAQRRLKFSEYQLFGWFAWTFDIPDYRWRQLYEHHTPLSKIGDHSWLLHFSSKEPLEPDQEKQLRQAAGLEAL